MKNCVNQITLQLVLCCCIGLASITTITNERDSRIFALFSVTPQSCQARFGELLIEGFCDTIASCLINQGTKVGTCSGAPICCLVSKACGQIASTRSFYIINENYPTATTESSCEITIRRFSATTCQVLLELEEFVVDDPVSEICINGFLEIEGTHPNYPVPIICGANNNQHMYLSFTPTGGDITVKIKATSGNWFIKATQLECDPEADPLTAPDGCLQYFTTAAGAIRSFGQVSENYDICLEKTSPTCTFSYSPSLFNFPTNPNCVNVNCFGSECVIGGNYLSIDRVSSISGIGNTDVRNDFCGTLTSTNSVVVSAAGYRIRVSTANEMASFVIAFNRTCS